MKAEYDAAIIGGGIVGAATAMAILEAKANLRIVVVEAEERLASHQTGNNSGVIHSGLYYKPGSLKAENCVIGRELLYAFCQENNIPHERCGKIVIAVSEAEQTRLKDLAARGRANGLSDIRELNSEQIRDYEPYAFGRAGLFVPYTGIVDYRVVTETYAKKIREFQGDIILSSKVVALRKNQSTFTLVTTQNPIHCKNLINCAGLHSDHVAKMCGLDPHLQIIPFRGEYYKMIPAKRRLVKNLIYPVPDPQFPFLGVHFTRMINGELEMGPNAVLAFKRDGYKKTSFSLKDAIEISTYAGFWKMAFKHWKMGVGEMYRSFAKPATLKALQRLVPEVQLNDMIEAGAGVRAQALEVDGRLVDDFRIIEADRMIHVLNAPSPAATASISIGRKIAGLAEKNFFS